MTPAEAPNRNKVIQPNKMTYTDAQGKQQCIYMPKGTYQTATRHFVENNFEELAKFPAWANQKYEEGDEIEVKEDEAERKE